MKKIPYSSSISCQTLVFPNKTDIHNWINLSQEPFKVIGPMQNWTFYNTVSQLNSPKEQCDYLTSLALDEKVCFTILSSKEKGSLRLNEKFEQNFSFSSQETKFPDFINQVKKYLSNPEMGTIYLQSSPLKGFFKAIEDFNLFNGFAPISEPGFWIGAGSQFVALHNDPFSNFIGLFTGRKRVIMFPPDELPNLYPTPFDKRLGGVFTSLVDVFNPNFEKFPLFHQALKRVMIAVINPGEMLYVPPLWWHAVEGEGFNVGWNCWFYDDEKKNKFISIRKFMAIYKLATQYFPGKSLLRVINFEDLPKSTRIKLYENYMLGFNTGSSTSIKMNAMELKVYKAAKNLREILHNAPLRKAQKHLWKLWIQVFAAQYVFCIKGNPFPSLPSNTFNDMVKRLQNVNFRQEFLMKFAYVKLILKKLLRKRVYK